MLYQILQVHIINVIAGDQYKITGLHLKITLNEIMQIVQGEHRQDLHLMLYQVVEST